MRALVQCSAQKLHGVFQLLIFGILWVFVAMAVRSLKDDLGYYVPKEEILRDMKRKGGNN